jgi:hypothetical protein
MPLHTRPDAIEVPGTVTTDVALLLAERHARLATEHLGALFADSAGSERHVERAHAHAMTSCAWTNIAYQLERRG